MRENRLSGSMRGGRRSWSVRHRLLSTLLRRSCYSRFEIRKKICEISGQTESDAYFAGAASVATRFHAAEAEVIARGAHLALAARADHVARAVLVGAEERAAAVHALLLGRLGGIERSVRALRIARDAARRLARA